MIRPVPEARVVRAAPDFRAAIRHAAPALFASMKSAFVERDSYHASMAALISPMTPRIVDRAPNLAKQVKIASRVNVEHAPKAPWNAMPDVSIFRKTANIAVNATSIAEMARAYRASANAHKAK